LATTATSITKDSVINNIGSLHHIFNDKKWFTFLYSLNLPACHQAADGGYAKSSAIGAVIIPLFKPDGKAFTLNLTKVLYNPDSPCNLLSQGQLRNGGIVLDGFNDMIVYRDDRVLAAVDWCCNIAVVRIDYTKIEQHDINPLSIEVTFSNRPIVTYKQMHERMFHAGPDRVILACKRARIKIFATKAYSYVCEPCNLAKARILINHMPFIFSQRSLAFVYFNTISNKLGYGFKRYIVHAVDAYSRFHWIDYTNNKVGQIMGELCISMVKRLELQTSEKL
jgi:hypothetical protein